AHPAAVPRAASLHDRPLGRRGRPGGETLSQLGDAGGGAASRERRDEPPAGAPTPARRTSAPHRPAAPRTPPAPTAARPLSGRRARRRSPAARAAPRPGPPRTGPAPSRPPREGAAHGLARARR